MVDVIICSVVDIWAVDMDISDCWLTVPLNGSVLDGNLEVVGLIVTVVSIVISVCFDVAGITVDQG